MLGWILLGAVIGVAVGAIVVKYLDKDTAKKKLKELKKWKGVVKKIVKDGNVTHIKMDTLDENFDKQEIEIDAENYNASEIYEGLIIYA